MPLRELIIIAKCGQSVKTAIFLRNLSINVIQNNGNVRELNLLGDRILSKQIKSKDGKQHLVGRYLQMLFDGNDECKQELLKLANESSETLRYRVHNVKDFYNQAEFFKRTLEEHQLVLNQQAEKQKFNSTLVQMASSQNK